MAIRPDLRDELMQLSAEERLELAEQLYASVPPLDAGVAEAWARELRSRVEALRQGRVVGVPAHEAIADLRARAARDA
jgi:putative addiction module component (TIGR02574 family)